MSIDAYETPSLITAVEFAGMLQVSVRTLWRLRSAGQVPAPVRLGGAVRWRLDEVKKWIADGCRKPSDLG
ncbi:MAG: helix-turn-helix domain-containing protein [Thermoguttaceae bacterium]